MFGFKKLSIKTIKNMVYFFIVFSLFLLFCSTCSGSIIENLETGEVTTGEVTTGEVTTGEVTTETTGELETGELEAGEIVVDESQDQFQATQAPVQLPLQQASVVQAPVEQAPVAQDTVVQANQASSDMTVSKSSNIGTTPVNSDTTISKDVVKVDRLPENQKPLAELTSSSSGGHDHNYVHDHRDYDYIISLNKKSNQNEGSLIKQATDINNINTNMRGLEDQMVKVENKMKDKIKNKFDELKENKVGKGAFDELKSYLESQYNSLLETVNKTNQDNEEIYEATKKEMDEMRMSPPGLDVVTKDISDLKQFKLDVENSPVFNQPPVKAKPPPPPPRQTTYRNNKRR